MTGELLVIVNLSLFFVHELDAVRCCEWRMLFGFNRLNDDHAHQLFVALHLPLLVVMLWLFVQPDVVLRFWFEAIFDAFLIAHLGLHLAFAKHPENRFTSWFSKTVLVLMALGGGLHGLLLTLTPQAVL